MRGQEKYIFVIVYCCKKNACVERKLNAALTKSRAGRARGFLMVCDARRSIYGARSLAVCAERCYNILGKIKVGGLAQHTVSTQWLMIRGARESSYLLLGGGSFFPSPGPGASHKILFLCCCDAPRHYFMPISIYRQRSIHAFVLLNDFILSTSSTNEMHGGAFFVCANASRLDR
jgi:hypothetical protein